MNCRKCGKKKEARFFTEPSNTGKMTSLLFICKCHPDYYKSNAYNNS